MIKTTAEISDGYEYNLISVDNVWVDRDSEINFLSSQIVFIEIGDVHSLESNIRKRIKELMNDEM